MAKQKHSRRPWWQLDLMVLTIIGLLFLVHRLAPSPGWRTFLDVAIVVTGYGVIASWLEKHSSLLLDSSAEADSPAGKVPRPEMAAKVRYQFYAEADSPPIDAEPARLNGNLRVNGHGHLAEKPLSLPENEENC